MGLRIRRRGFYKPLGYFALYILLTVLISFFGPRVYEGYNKISVFIYICSFLFLFSIGYHLGVIAPVHPVRTASYRRKDARIIIFLKICIMMSFLSVLVNFLTAFDTGKLSLSLSNIGQNYLNFYAEHRASNGGHTVAQIVNFFTGFPRLVTMVLGIYYFRTLPRLYKFLVIAFLALWIITNTFSYGNQRAFGEIVIYILVVSVIKMLDLSPLKRRGLYALLICLVVLFGVSISIIQYQRLAASGIIFDIDQRMNWLNWYDWDHVIFRLLGFEAGLALASFITGYLSGGYYGLSLCLQLPFVWTYGVGNSYSLMAFLDRFCGIHFILERTYLLRMQNEIGWNGLMAWNTIFPWLASDLTFVGALIIFIPVAYIYALCWKEIIRYRNPLSILMFSMLTLGLIFVPANNQLLHGVDGLITTSIMGLIWIIKHKTYNYCEGIG